MSELIQADFNATGNLVLFSMMCLIPLILYLAAPKTQQGQRNPWILLPMGLIYAVLFLFQLYDQFLWIEVEPDRSAWRFVYPLSGATTVDPGEFDQVLSVKEAKGARIVISTKDGRVFRSAKVAKHRLPEYEAFIQEYRAPAPALERGEE